MNPGEKTTWVSNINNGNQSSQGLYIPSIPPTGLSGCKLIHINYFLKVVKSELKSLLVFISKYVWI